MAMRSHGNTLMYPEVLATAGILVRLSTQPEEGVSISFRMKTSKKIRAELAKMTDAQLIEHGKTIRKFCRRVSGQKIDKGWLMQWNEARAEWRRRHSPKKVSDGLTPRGRET
jgi:hypothetical protein